MTNFDIRIISDPVCPWCYMTSRRLDRAIQLYQRTVPGGRDDTFTITWMPHFLDPSAPSVGIPYAERQQQHFPDATPQELEAKQAKLRNWGRAEGINFRFDCKIGRTRDAHRLLEMALVKGGNEVQGRVVQGLFRRYFEEGGDITSWDMLVSAGVEGGLDEGDCREWLESGKGGKEVDGAVAKVNEAGLKGVPHFYVNGEWLGQDSPDVEGFLEVFVKIKDLP